MRIMTSNTPRVQPFPWAGVVCWLAGALVFQFFGNANRGYIDSASLFYWWGFQWVNPGSETEHGWLILGLSLWVYWRNRQRTPFIGAASESVMSAALAMLTGLGLHAVGFTAQQARISLLGLLLFAWGAVRLIGGRRGGAAAAFPIAFMVFAIPINVLDSFGFWLRMWVIDASAGLAQVMGLDVVRSGTQLLAPDGRYQYDVAAACSGVRSLTALVALSLLAGYFSFQTWWRRAAILVWCFPLVYLGNVARISVIILAGQWGGQIWGERAHTLMGYGVFGIVLGGVLGGISVIQRFWPERERETKAGSPSATGSRQVAPVFPPRRALKVVAGLITVVSLGEMVFLHRLRSLPPRGEVGVWLSADGKNPVDLPAFLGTEWIGRRAEITAIERDILPPDTGFARKNYVPIANPAQPVFLSIVLSGRDRTSIHRPELCLVGQGWTIVGARQHALNYPQRPEANFEATLLQVQREIPSPQGAVVVPQLTAYWFVSGDGVVATHGQRFIRDAWNRVRHARADRWAYVLMQTDASDGEDRALARMQSVLDATLPVFQRPMATTQ